MAHILPSEFDLHILKKCGVRGKPDNFTIAVWDGLLTLSSVCHALPIEDALVALRQILETAGHALPTTVARSRPVNHALLRKKID